MSIIINNKSINNNSLKVNELKEGKAYKVVKDTSDEYVDLDWIVIGIRSGTFKNNQGNIPYAIQPSNGVVWDSSDDLARFVEVDIEINVLN